MVVSTACPPTVPLGPFPLEPLDLLEAWSKVDLGAHCWTVTVASRALVDCDPYHQKVSEQLRLCYQSLPLYRALTKWRQVEPVALFCLDST